jgi:MoaA/NifB/PqqE/SkfB family radical SAM enzyme
MKISGYFNQLHRVMRYAQHHKHEIFSGIFWEQVLSGFRRRWVFNKKEYQSDLTLNLASIEKRPWNLHLELTNICNSNCIFCAYQYQTRKKIIMSDEVYGKALDQYCEMGGGELMINSVVGEPTIDGNFLQRVQEARSRKEITEISTITNGILLDKLGIDNLLLSGITHIMVSLAAFDKDIYNKIYRNDNYEKVKNNIYSLLKRNSELNTPVKITLGFRSNLTMKHTVKLPDYQPLIKYPHELQFNLDFDDWGGQIKAEDLLEGMHIKPLRYKENEPCYCLYDGPVIFADGKIGLCGGRDFNASSGLIVGNIANDRLLDVWQGGLVKELRERFYQGNYPDICDKCTIYYNLDLYRTTEGNNRRFFIERVFCQNPSS